MDTKAAQDLGTSDGLAGKRCVKPTDPELVRAYVLAYWPAIAQVGKAARLARGK